MGEYWYVPEDKNTLHYEGEFKYDKRHGDGKLTCTTDKTLVVYVGNFEEDKRSGRVDELAVGPNKEVIFKGQMNSSEQMDCAHGTVQIDTAFVTALDDQ